MNLALLALLPAALAGLAAACFLLEWTRAASAALPGLQPAGLSALPWLLLALAAGAAAGGRAATHAGRGPLSAAMRWLAGAAAAVIAAVWVLDALLPTGGELVLEGAARTALATLPAAPALLLLGGAWTRLASARRAPAGRALGGVLAAAAAGAAPGLLLAPGWVADGASFLRVSALALLGAALGCAALAAFESPAAAERETLPARGRAGSAVGGGLAALVGACVACVVPALLRFAWPRSGADFTSTTELLAALAAGVAVGAAGAARLARPESWRAWTLLALAPIALLVGPLEPRLAAGLLGLDLGAAIVLASPAGGDAREAAWGLACACAGLALGALAADHLTLERWSSGERLRGTALVAALGALAGGAWRGGWLARGVVLLPAAALAVVAWTRPAPATPWRTEPGDGALVEQLEDPRGTLTLVSTTDGGTRRELDGWTLPGGAAGAVAARRMARLSAAMAPDAQSALLVGAGDGQMLLGLDELLPGRVECIEPLGSLVGLARDAPPPEGVTLTPPEHADPRATVAGRAAAWDLVIVGPQPPGRLGQGETLSLEHLLALRGALRPAGVAVQWLPLHQMSWPAFASAAQSFLEAFPETRVFLASLRSPEPLVALVGGNEGGLPGAERLDAFLATAPSAAGVSGAADVFDLYLCDGWVLGGKIRSAPASTLARPLAELLSARHEGQAVPLAIMNLRLLADLATPLDVVSLSARPVAEKDSKALGAQLVARSSALRWLLVALAARLERQSAAAGALSADDRGALEDEQGAALLAAWAAAPGHADVAQALLGFAAELVAARRWSVADALLSTAAATQADGRLLGLRAGVLIELNQVDEALGVGRQAREAAPKDPNALVNLARALLVTAQDDEALDVLRAAREAFAPAPLPPLHAACLALLEGEADARSRAEALLAQIPAGEVWAVVLRRLIARRR